MSWEAGLHGDSSACRITRARSCGRLTASATGRAAGYWAGIWTGLTLPQSGPL